MADASTDIERAALGGPNNVPISPRIRQMGSGWRDTVGKDLHIFRTSESGQNMTADEKGGGIFRRKPQSAPKSKPVVFKEPELLGTPRLMSKRQARREAGMVARKLKRAQAAAALDTVSAPAEPAIAAEEPPPTVDQVIQAVKNDTEVQAALTSIRIRDEVEAERLAQAEAKASRRRGILRHKQ